MLPLIPAYQTLGPRSLWKRQRPESLPYPLNHDRTRRYYLGRNAVYHGAKALGLSTGDEVVFPAYHSGTESAPLLHLGCRLNFYNVAHDCTIDLDEVEAKITPRTKALYVIHFFGFPGPINELREIADRYGLWLIEDVALSFLGRHHGRPLGTWGDISIFCMYKSLPVAAGGMLAVNNPDVPLPPEPRGGSAYSELNLTVKHMLNHLELHRGRPGRFLRKLIEWPVRRVVKGANLRVRQPDSLDFDPSLLEWGFGPIATRLLNWFDYERIAQRRRDNYRWLAEELRDSGVIVLRDEIADDTVPLFFPVFAEDKFGSVHKLWADQIEAVPVWGVHHSYLPHDEFLETEFLMRHAVEVPIPQDLTRRHLVRIRDSLVRHCRWTGTEQLAEWREARLASV